MKTLNNYINEGLFKSSISKVIIKTMDDEDLHDDFLDLCVCIEENDMEDWFEDYTQKEKIFWKTIYDLYQKNIWQFTIFDASIDDVFNVGKWKKIDRRDFKKLKKVGSITRNSDLRKSIRIIDKGMFLLDYDTTIFIYTTKKINKLINFADEKLLDEFFEKVGKVFLGDMNDTDTDTDTDTDIDADMDTL